LVEVAIVVFAVFDKLPVFVGLPGIRSPAFEVLVEADADDFVGSEEAVRDAVPQRVDIDRVAEVFAAGLVPPESSKPYDYASTGRRDKLLHPLLVSNQSQRGDEPTESASDHVAGI